MNEEEFATLLEKIAAHATGDNIEKKTHLPEFNDPSLGPPLNLSDKDDLAEHLKQVLTDPSAVFFAQDNGQAFFYHRETNTAVLFDSQGGGTAFRPHELGDYLQGKHYRHGEHLETGLELREGGIHALHPELAHGREPQRPELKAELPPGSASPEPSNTKAVRTWERQRQAEHRRQREAEREAKQHSQDLGRTRKRDPD